jgi:hypothetical protein
MNENNTKRLIKHEYAYVAIFAVAYLIGLAISLITNLGSDKYTSRGIYQVIEIIASLGTMLPVVCMSLMFYITVPLLLILISAFVFTRSWKYGAIIRYVFTVIFSAYWVAIVAVLCTTRWVH